jgi:hypothetical protein
MKDKKITKPQDLESDPESIKAFIEKLSPILAEIVEYIRQVILNTDPEIGERIKWNNPSFFYTGEMKEFNPKEYKREIVVFNLFKGRVMLVFPSGAKVNDTTGLLTGDYPDGRRLIIFKDLAEVKSQEEALQNVIKTWLSMVEKD